MKGTYTKVEKEKYIAIGLMSGTSVDSVDAVAIKVNLEESGIKIHLIKGISYPIPDCLKNWIFELFENGPQSLHKVTLLNMRLGTLFAEAVMQLLKNAGLKPTDVTVIGSHGQTAHHISFLEECCGEKISGSMQIGEASVIAQKTGIPVVSDFRTADIAAGGTGAPLVPFLDIILFQDWEEDIAAQNLGGIGNVTWIPQGDEKALAFDTGPGNLIIDLFVEKYTKGNLHFDKDGIIGKGGKVITELLGSWMKHPFFSQNPPKSAGREEFGTAFLSTYMVGLNPSSDLIRTAEEFTALSIAQAYKDFLPRMPAKVIVTGGGAHNPIIMEALAKYLGNIEVFSGNEVGIDVDFKEAVAFALLGLWRFLGKTNNVPEATGARRKVILGKLSLP